MSFFEGSRPQEDGVIRYGDQVSLKHVSTNRYVSSSGGENYDSGSNQQKVFTVDGSPDEQSTWIVLPPPVSEEEPGYEVGWDDQVRLKHVPTRGNLHSHELQSPVSGQQEVSCFGNDESSDDNDVWVVERFNEDEGDDFWRANQPFVLRHLATGKVLHSHEIVLEDNRNEVTSYDGLDDNDKWVISFD